MKIAVLMGGLSKERDVSLRSGKAVAEALGRKGHDVSEVDAQSFEAIAALKSQGFDAAFIALHGKFGEDGSIQGLLEWMRLPYTGPSVFCSALCFDKLATKEMAQRAGIATPDYQVCRCSDDLAVWLKNFNLGFPCIVKPNREGSTIGMSRVFEAKELKPALEKALQFDEVVLAERYIQGREVTVGVHKGKTLSIVEVVPKSGFYDYESKYTKGKTEYRVPAVLEEKLEKKIRTASEKAYEVLRCHGAVRMDFMLGGDEPYFLEANTIPGMTETSLLPKSAQVVGISFEDLCDLIVKEAKLHL